MSELPSQPAPIIDRIAYSPPALGKLYGITPEKIIAWIRSGELLALDVTASPGNTKPRYRVRGSDWEAFLKRREVCPRPEQPTRQRRKKQSTVTEFF